MDTSDSEILRITNDIFIDRENLTIDELNSKYSAFKEKFPKFFEGALEFEDKQKFLDDLKVLLNFRKTRTSKTAEFASNIQVGEHYGKKYIYPLVGEPSVEQKKIALSKILKENAQNKV